MTVCCEDQEAYSCPDINIRVDGDCDMPMMHSGNSCQPHCQPAIAPPYMYPPVLPSRNVNVSVNIDNRKYTKANNPWPIGCAEQGIYVQMDDCGCPDPLVPTVPDPDPDSDDGALSGTDCYCTTTEVT